MFCQDKNFSKNLLFLRSGRTMLVFYFWLSLPYLMLFPIFNSLHFEKSSNMVKNCQKIKKSLYLVAWNAFLHGTLGTRNLVFRYPFHYYPSRDRLWISFFPMGYSRKLNGNMRIYLFSSQKRNISPFFFESWDWTVNKPRDTLRSP